MTKRLSRIAPSPTGALHLGNARTFLVNWALARQRDWRLILRIEDLDGPRVKPDAAEQTLDILRWLGLDHDGEVIVQSADLSPYRDALEKLATKRLVFACRLSRRDIEQAASAPHANEHETRYDPQLRPDDPAAYEIGQADANYRFLVPEESISFEDEFSDSQVFRPCDEVGDFVVWTKRNLPAYQLAVVVDDARQGVTDVVRGDDLLRSTARQVLLYRSLELKVPRFWHLPLVYGSDGRRLAKRHGDTRLVHYRERGVPPERVIGLLARWCGLIPRRETMDHADFLRFFALDKLSPESVTFTQDDHAWLLGDSS